MAGTVLDALIVTLGLDASKFTAGSKAIDAHLRGMSERSDATAKGMELGAKRIVEGFSRVRTELLGLFALLVAGRGLKELTADITGGDASLGRLAKTLDMSASDLAKWEGAAQRAGGSVEGMAGSFATFSSEVEDWELLGKGDPEFLKVLNLLDVKLYDTNGKLKSFSEDFLELADRMQHMDPRRATALGKMLGLDQGTINLLEQGRAAVQALLDQQAKLGVPSAADVKRAQDILNRLRDLQQAFESLARVILNNVTPALTGLMTQFASWLEKNGPMLKTQISDRIKQFITYLQSVDWSAIGASIAALAASAKSVVDALGGVVHTTEILFGLWAGAKFLGMLKGIGLLRTAIAGGEGVGLVGAFGTLLGSIAAALGLAATLKGDTDPNATPEGFRKGWKPDNTGESFSDTWIGRTVGKLFGEGAKQKALSAEAMAFFTNHGWTPEQAAGIVGNIQQESGFNVAAGAGTAHQGIAQWDAARQADIEKHFHKPLMSMSYAEQLAAIQWELTQGKYAQVGAALRNAHTAPEASGIIDHRYEMPGNHLREDQTRGANAARALGRYNKGKALPDIPPIPSLVSYVPTAHDRWGGTVHHHNNSVDNRSDVRTQNVNVTVPKGDAAGVAAGIRTAMSSQTSAAQMNRGLA